MSVDNAPVCPTIITGLRGKLTSSQICLQLESRTLVPAAYLRFSLLSLTLALLYLASSEWLRAPALFAWNCFAKPFIHSNKTSDQQGRLNAFYSGQAKVYDNTRTHLLKGRETMLQLLAAHIRAQPPTVGLERKPRIWVDIGGGTGWNLEKM